MRFYAFLTASLLLLGSCQPDVNIDSDRVAEELTAYGKAHPEQHIVIHTSYGDMYATLYIETPLHRANFLRLIEKGFYNDGNIYRIVQSFMIQGGSATHDKPKYTIPSEINPKLIHKRGALAMARYDENNPGKASSPTEFYVVQGRIFLNEDLDELKAKYPPEQLQILSTIGGAPDLDQQYTVFGEVNKGLEVIDKIASLKTYNEDKPLEKIPFSIEVLK